jgi:hypothetical protein
MEAAKQLMTVMEAERKVGNKLKELRSTNDAQRADKHK